MNRLTVLPIVLILCLSSLTAQNFSESYSAPRKCSNNYMDVDYYSFSVDNQLNFMHDIVTSRFDHFQISIWSITSRRVFNETDSSRLSTNFKKKTLRIIFYLRRDLQVSKWKTPVYCYRQL